MSATPDNELTGARRVLLYARFREQDVPGPFLVQWGTSYIREKGFDSYSEAVAFALQTAGAVGSVNDCTPLFLAGVESVESLLDRLAEFGVQAEFGGREALKDGAKLMALPARERERRFEDLPLDQALAMREIIERLECLSCGASRLLASPSQPSIKVIDKMVKGEDVVDRALVGQMAVIISGQAEDGEVITISTNRTQISDQTKACLTLLVRNLAADGIFGTNSL